MNSAAKATAAQRKTSACCVSGFVKSPLLILDTSSSGTQGAKFTTGGRARVMPDPDVAGRARVSLHVFNDPRLLLAHSGCCLCIQIVQCISITTQHSPTDSTMAFAASAILNLSLSCSGWLRDRELQGPWPTPKRARVLGFPPPPKKKNKRNRAPPPSKGERGLGDPPPPPPKEKKKNKGS